MVGILVESTTHKASAVDRVVHLVQMFLRGCPPMCILRYLALATWGECIEGLAVDAPVNVVKGSRSPVFRDVGVVAAGAFDDVGLMSGCRGCNASVVFDLLSDWSPFV